MHTITTTVYTFDELNDKAKEKAREWFREGNLDYEWWDSLYEDADTCARLIGIEIDSRPRNNPKAMKRPQIYFTGFWSQGDGASYTGYYSYAKDGTKAIRRHAPEDKELHRIADELQALQRKNFYQLTAQIKQRGPYCHEMTMQIDVARDGVDCSSDVEEEVTQLLRDFARWIYRQLETEYEWLQSDQQIDESIRANEYTFDEHGNREG